MKAWAVPAPCCMKPPPVEAPCCAKLCQPIFSAGAAAAASGAAAAACCCGSMPCESPPNALPVAAPDAWYASPSFWKSKFGSVKKRKLVSRPCCIKLPPVSAPACANGIQPTFSFGGASPFSRFI